MSCQNPEVPALIESLKQSLPQKGLDGSYNREQLKEVAERLSIALETPGETCQRVAYYVRPLVHGISYVESSQIHPAYILLLSISASPYNHCPHCEQVEHLQHSD